MSVADAVRKMIELGASADMVAAAVEGMVAAAAKNASAPPSEPNRSAAAERMRRYRENRVANGLEPFFDAAKHRAALVARDGDGCGYCDNPDAGTVDHIVPTSCGGTDMLGNLVLACNACNGGKSGRPLGGRYILQRQTAQAAHVRYLAERSEQSPEQGEHVRVDAEQKAPTTLKTTTLRDITPSDPKGSAAPTKPRRALRQGCRIDAGFQPTDRDWTAAIEKLGSEARAREELAKFIDHFLARDGPEAFAADWDARFRTWVRKAVEYGNRDRNNGRPAFAGHQSRRSGVDAYAASLDRYLDERGIQGPGWEPDVEPDTRAAAFVDADWSPARGH